MQARTLTAWTVAAVLLALTSYAEGADSSQAKSPTVTISVNGMHCAGCAKKVETKLKALAGVDQVKIDVAKGTVAVNPRAKKELSPRLLWETVEKAGYQPTKIAGPAGTFTAKPKS